MNNNLIVAITRVNQTAIERKNLAFMVTRIIQLFYMGRNRHDQSCFKGKQGLISRLPYRQFLTCEEDAHVEKYRNEATDNPSRFRLYATTFRTTYETLLRVKKNKMTIVENFTDGSQQELTAIIRLVTEIFISPLVADD